MNLFRNLSIAQKISLSFSLLLVAVLAFGLWTYSFSSRVHQGSELILQESQPFATLAEQMSRDIIQVQQWLTDISATRGQDGLDDGFAEAEASYQSFMDGLKQFEGMYRRENDSVHLQQVEQLKGQVASYYAVGKKMAQAYIDQGPAGGNLEMANFDGAAAALTATLEPFIAQQTDELRNELLSMQDKAASLKTGVILICAAVAIIFLLVGWTLIRAVASPLKKTVRMIKQLENGHLATRLRMDSEDEIGEMAKAMDRFADNLQNEVIGTLQKIASGDLTTAVRQHDTEDEVREAIKRLQQDLTTLLLQVQSASEQIDSGSRQVAEASQSLSQGATETAASIEQIGASINQMASQTKLNAENASQANKLANETSQVAGSGNQHMNEMVSAMQEIDAAGKDISKIIKVIDEIAFQTNLLALNAAVEAARAGQHGKGFAVVAEEVRNLAARSAKAARETAELIEGSVAKTRRGSEIAKTTSNSLSKIVASTAKVTDLIGEISAASNEQAQGIGQINIGLAQIDQVIQQNTASAEECAATSEQLSSQAQHLNQLLGRFRLTGGEKVRTVPIPPTTARKATARTAKNIGWTDMAAGKQKPAIRLDDDEFGKF
ncbi:MAG TPA: methyl-accepting chemotaxis protein [Malonomonas sp.]